jgi:hypothetical protein
MECAAVNEFRVVVPQKTAHLLLRLEVPVGSLGAGKPDFNATQHGDRSPDRGVKLRPANRPAPRIGPCARAQLISHIRSLPLKYLLAYATISLSVG